jgi:hypothetical protein
MSSRTLVVRCLGRELEIDLEFEKLSKMLDLDFYVFENIWRIK